MIKSIPTTDPDLNLIDVTTLDYGFATKTKSLVAKPLQSILVDDSVIAKFLLDTIEGIEILKVGTIDNPTMVCIGQHNDAWQQTSSKLFQKYTVVSVDGNGWMKCEPKPENRVKACQINFTKPLIQWNDDTTFDIIAQWGTERMIGMMASKKQVFTQRGMNGDYVMQSETDPTDVWIVKRKIFESTYSMIEPQEEKHVTQC